MHWLHWMLPAPRRPELDAGCRQLVALVRMQAKRAAREPRVGERGCGSAASGDVSRQKAAKEGLTADVAAGERGTAAERRSGKREQAADGARGQGEGAAAAVGLSRFS